MPERNLDDLSEAQIRLLLAQKLRSDRRARLERYRRTGRLVSIVSDGNPPAWETFRTVQLLDGDEPRPTGLRNSLPGRFLSIVEMLVLLGFVIALLAGSLALKTLNRQSSLVFEPPGLTPTPLIRAVVIPSGHTPPDSPDGARPNEAEIPFHLRPLVQAQALAMPQIPTPGPEFGVRIRIPAINVDAPIVQGDGWEQLKKGVAQRLETANPGQKGNMVLSGHNDIFGEVFRYLDRLEPGDEIIVYTPQRAYTYRISGWELVEPTRVEVMDPTPDATITLISCYPYLIDRERIIVKGQLVG